MADTTIVIPAGSALDKELERAADASGSTKTDIVMLAISEWLSEQDEVAEILSRIDRNEPTYSIAEVRQHLGLDDARCGRNL